MRRGEAAPWQARGRYCGRLHLYRVSAGGGSENVYGDLRVDECAEEADWAMLQGTGTSF